MYTAWQTTATLSWHIQTSDDRILLNSGLAWEVVGELPIWWICHGNTEPI